MIRARLLIVAGLLMVALAGCQKDTSMDTRQVAPADPQKVPGKPDLPPQAQSAIQKGAAPPPSGPAATGQ